MHPDFNPFNIAHIVVLIILLIGIIGVYTLPKNKKYRLHIRYTLAILLILQIITFNSYHLINNSFDIQRFLPFHLCSISAYLVSFALLSKNNLIKAITYFWAPVAAFMAIVFPAMGTNDNFPSFRFIEFFWSHLLIVIGVFFIIHVDKPTIKWKHMWISYGILAVYSLIVYGINLALDANYLYLIKPQFPMTYFGETPYHIIGMALLILGIFTVQKLILKNKK